MGGPRGWEIPFPPFLTQAVGEKSPHGWPPWVGNPFPTLLDTSHGQEIPPWVAPVGGKSLSHPS